MKRSSFAPKISAVSCYHSESGRLLYTVRLRVHIPTPQQVGRHTLQDQKPHPVLSLSTRIADSAELSLVDQAKSWIPSVSNLDVEALAKLLEDTSKDSKAKSFVWVAHFPWERPKESLESLRRSIPSPDDELRNAS